MPKLTLEDGTEFTGKLVHVGDDGTKTPFDPLGTHATFGTIRGERDSFKTAAETAAAELALFGKSPEDRKAAAEKLRLAANLDAKKLVEAGKIDELVAERLRAAQEEWGGKEKTLASERDELARTLDEILIEKAFAGSKVLDDYFPTWSLLAPVFESQLAREGKQLVGYRDAAKKERIYSATKPGELAQGDELLAALLKSHPDHDKWRKGANAQGTGATGNTGGAGGAKTMTVDQFNALDPQKRMDFINKEGGQVV